MRFSYEDLISGDSIPVLGIAHFRSPKLKELKPTQGVGINKYGLYLSLMTWEQEDLIEFIRAIRRKRMAPLDKAKDLNVFQILSLVSIGQELYKEAIGFFIDEELTWDDENKRFLVKTKGTGELYGEINNDNFEDVRDMILQVNYIAIGNNGKPVRFDSPEAKRAWEQMQKYKKKVKKPKSKDESMSLGNIISKLCVVSNGYTLLNIYELTIFQLYDQFFQYGYIRGINLHDRIFSIHGGKKFDIQSWLKPLS